MSNMTQQVFEEGLFVYLSITELHMSHKILMLNKNTCNTKPAFIGSAQSAE